MKKVMEMFNFSIDKELQAGFHQELAEKAVQISLIIAPLIMIFQIANMIMMTFFRKEGLGTFPHRVYFAMYVFLFLVALGYFIYVVKKGDDSCKDGVRAKKFLTQFGVFTFILCLWSTLITLYDQRASENVTVYIYTVLGIVAVVYLRPRQSILIFGSCQVILLSFFTLFQTAEINNMGNYTNTTVIAILAIFISMNRYYNKKQDYLNHVLIKQQNNKIQGMNQALNRLVMRDHLTGAYNRRFLDELLPEKWEESVATKQQVGIIMLDIDDFKLFNDTYGHQAGDECLKEVSKTIKQVIEPLEGYLVRCGGEEFMVLLFGYSQKEVEEIGEQICQRVRALNRIHCESQKGIVTCSIGAFVDNVDPNRKPDDFIRLADKGLYESKTTGKDKVTLRAK